MIDPRIPPEEVVEVETPLGTLTLHYGMGAWVRYQRLTGHSILREPWTTAHMEDTERCMILLHCGVRGHHPEISLEDLEQSLTLRDMDRILPRMLDAIRASSPAPQSDEESEEDPPQAQS